MGFIKEIDEIELQIGKRVQKTTSQERDQEARYLRVLTELLKAFRFLRVFDRLRPLALAASTRSLRAYLNSTPMRITGC